MGVGSCEQTSTLSQVGCWGMEIMSGSEEFRKIPMATPVSDLLILAV